MNAKIQFLEKLEKYTGGMNQIAEYLVSVGLVNENQIKTIFAKPENIRAAEIHLLLTNLSSRISFMDYEWTILPNETMKFTIVTENSSKIISWPA